MSDIYLYRAMVKLETRDGKDFIVYPNGKEYPAVYVECFDGFIDPVRSFHLKDGLVKVDVFNNKINWIVDLGTYTTSFEDKGDGFVLFPIVVPAQKSFLEAVCIFNNLKESLSVFIPNSNRNRDYQYDAVNVELTLERDSDEYIDNIVFGLYHVSMKHGSETIYSVGYRRLHEITGISFDMSNWENIIKSR